MPIIDSHWKGRYECNEFGPSKEFDSTAKRNYRAVTIVATAESKRKASTTNESARNRLRAVSCEHNDANLTLDNGKNTNQHMYYKNQLYRKICNFCQSNIHYNECMVQHYVRDHPDFEVPISRMSPEMVKLLKKQEDRHQIKNKKITGLCYFCEDEKSFSKLGWQR